MNTSYIVSEAPPPYPGPSSAFVLPPYEAATGPEYWADSSRLPPYQSRTAQRFHPYVRILPVHRGYIPHQEKSFEEFYRSLQESVTSPAVVEPRSAPPSHPAHMFLSNLPAAPPPPPAVEPGLGLDPEERRHRLIRHLFLLPEIIRIVRAGLGAAMRAAEARSWS